MTDNEIIKALECCCGDDGCFGCPYTENHSCRLLRNPIKDALDLINRQKAEIERLTLLADLGNMRANDYRAMRDKLKKANAEIERLKKEKKKLISKLCKNGML